MVHVHRTELVRLTEAAAAVALSVLLGNIRLVELPSGGSLALATVPLLALAVARGSRLALFAGCCAGAAHALAGGTIIHPAQLGLDYLLAYAALALAGIGGGARGGVERRHLVAPIIIAMSAHLAAMVVSGMIFFAPSAGSAAFAYSLGYNALTVVPETALAIWLVPPLVAALARANPADSWRRGLRPPPRLLARSPRFHVPAPVVGAAPAPRSRVARGGRSPAPPADPRPSTAAFVRTAPSFAREPFATLRLSRQSPAGAPRAS